MTSGPPYCAKCAHHGASVHDDDCPERINEILGPRATEALADAGIALVPSGDMMTLIHFAHAWAAQNPTKVDAEEAELVERYMRAEHGQERVDES